jgi:hypothetical protein
MPLLYVHGAVPGRRGVLLWFSDHGKAKPDDWMAVRERVSEGYDLVTFDARGLGETRMRYTAESVDDPSLALKDFDRAYVNPLSSVLADYVYNAVLTGRPYLLQMIEDTEIAARFARAHLNAATISIAAEGDSYTLAHWAANVLPGVRLVANGDNRVLDWADLVEHKQEVWPIQYVFPGGAYLR